jgi:hypothetical protein
LSAAYFRVMPGLAVSNIGFSVFGLCCNLLAMAR